MQFNNYEDIVQMTPLWKGDRFPDAVLVWPTASWRVCGA